MSEQVATQYIEGMKLSERERAVLIEKLRKSGASDRRKHTRMETDGNFNMLLSMTYPGGASSHFRIYPWELSQGGLAFFHRAFIYSGTRCNFTGRTTDGQPFSFNGEVMHCHHVTGLVHTVGVKFEMEMDPEIFLGEAAVRAAGGAIADVPEDAMHKGVAEHAQELIRLSQSHAGVEQIKRRVGMLMQQLSPGNAAAPPTGAAPASPDQPHKAA